MNTIRTLNLFCIVGLIISILNFQIHKISAEPLIADKYHPLASGPLLQDWSDPILIVTNDDWSGVSSIEGYRGDGLVNSYNIDPKSVLSPDDNGVLDVNANILTSPNSNTGFSFGVTEFESQIKSIAIAGSSTADAPYIKIYLNTSTCSNIRIKYNVKDIEDSSDNSIQQVALHYRVGESGNFLDIPEGYIPDATEGPFKSGLITPIDVFLPPDTENQLKVEVRIMTTVYELADEWIAIDDIEISGTCVDPYKEPIIPVCPEEITTYEGHATNISFSASDADGIVVQAVILDDSVQGIQLANIQPAQNIGLDLTGELSIGADSTNGEHEIQIQFTNNDPNPQSVSCTIPINIIPLSCSKYDSHQIGNVQGAGSQSPLELLSPVTTSGVVTATFFEGGIDGFFLQDPHGDNDDLTSDALFISHVSPIIQVGQSVQVTGSVNEIYGRTQLETISQLEVCGIPPSITPVELSLPINDPADFEMYENMLVAFPQGLIINDYHNFDLYGELTLSSQRHQNPTSLFLPGSAEYEHLKNEILLDRIILDDGKFTYFPNPIIHPNGDTITLDNLFRGGDTLTNVTGILDYAYGSFRIQPTNPAEYANTNSRLLSPTEVGGDIQIGSLNVMNYFTTLGSRGASNEAEFTRQRDKLISTIIQLDADILGLVEIENNQTAIQDLVEGINTSVDEDLYTFIDTGIVGTDEIKVVLLYKSATVTPIGDYALMDTSIDPRFIDDKNRPSLAQTFSANQSGKKFTVVINHLKSKGSACDDIFDPDNQDGAGNCNLTRLGATQALVDWLATDPTQSNSHDFLIMGDLNSYTMEDPIQAILIGADNEQSTFDDYTNLIHQFVDEKAYNYVYDGKVGYLDHAMASNFLTQRVTGTSIWHINADEPNFLDYRLSSKNPALYAPDPFRAFDHDPILVGLDFSSDLPPIALSQTMESGLEDQPVKIILDVIDEFNRPLTYRIVDNPTYGNLELSGNEVIYTPHVNYFGSDSYSFIANNGIADSDPATISLKINPVNDRPTAQNDRYEINQNQILNVVAPGVLENDEDNDNDSLTAILVSAPEKGKLTLNSDGSFTYEPDKDSNGGDTFSYQVFDGSDHSDDGFVTIYINPIDVSDDHKIFLPLVVR